MTQFIELFINGLSLGVVYALVALGFVIIFKSTRVINFAHGSIVLLGAFLIAKLADDLGFLLAVARRRRGRGGRRGAPVPGRPAPRPVAARPTRSRSRRSASTSCSRPSSRGRSGRTC